MLDSGLHDKSIGDDANAKTIATRLKVQEEKSETNAAHIHWSLVEFVPATTPRILE